MVTYRIAGQRLLASSKVERTKSRNSKSVQHGGLYYSFVGKKDALYPIELYAALCPELTGYAMAFVRSNNTDMWLGIFIGEARKSVVVSSEALALHVMRYKEIMSGPIAIVNNVINTDDLENLDFISIEKEPRLIDPDEMSKFWIKSGLKLSAGLIIVVALSYTQRYFNEKTAELLLQTNNVSAQLVNTKATEPKSLSLLQDSITQAQDDQIKMLDPKKVTAIEISNGIAKWH